MVNKWKNKKISSSKNIHPLVKKENARNKSKVRNKKDFEFIKKQIVLFQEIETNVDNVQMVSNSVVDLPTEISIISAEILRESGEGCSNVEPKSLIKEQKSKIDKEIEMEEHQKQLSNMKAKYTSLFLNLFGESVFYGKK